MAGNVWEWTSETTNGTTAQQPGVAGGGLVWREWASITANGNLPINPFPTDTGLPGANTWDSGKGIEQLFSYSVDSYSFIRGGAYSSRSNAGVLALYLNSSTSNATAYFFRVSK